MENSVKVSERSKAIKKPKVMSKKIIADNKRIIKQTVRAFTISMAVPASIIDNAQSLELKTYLVGQIAKAATIFGVNELIIISDDKNAQMKGMMTDLTTTDFFAQNLEYLETPQYLRLKLFPKTPALRFAGLMNSIDAPHHLRTDEWHQFREGVVIKRPVKEGKGSWVNIGLKNQDCQVDRQIREDTRVTVKLDQTKFDEKIKAYSGKLVSPKEPFRQGTYWGYTVRVATTMDQVFNESPYKVDGKREPYDLKLVDSINVGKDVGLLGQSVEAVDFEAYRGFKHVLLVVGGLEGITGVLESLEGEATNMLDVKSQFDECLISCPEQSTRTIRTEECIFMALSQLMPYLRAVGATKERGSAKSVLL